MHERITKGHESKGTLADGWLAFKVVTWLSPQTCPMGLIYGSYCACISSFKPGQMWLAAR